MNLALKNTSALIKLTKYQSGSFRELFSLSLPLIGVLLSGSLMGFCDRWFLARSSLEEMTACVNASYLAVLFQIPCMRIASIAQVFVAQKIGAKSAKQIGSSIWQMIWFSFFTMGITFPLSSILGDLFFENTFIRQSASIYFKLLMNFNFLFPLGAALSSFYLGLGKTRMLIAAMLFSHLIHIIIDPILIFGVNGIVVPLGIMGSAISTISSQFLFCAILFGLFMRKDHQASYGTADWKLKWRAFKLCIYIGFPRAIGKMSNSTIGKPLV